MIDSGRLESGDKGHGILISAGHSADLYNNTIVGARYYGISYYSNLDSAHISNNLLSDIGDMISPIRDIGNDDILIEGNQYYDTASQGEFIDPALDDYRVASSNADVVDNATPPLIATKDFADNIRPEGPKPDIGAHENLLPVSWDHTFLYSGPQPLKASIAGYDPEGDAMTYTLAIPPEFGTVVLEGARFVYSPALTFPGRDMFTVEFSDGIERSTWVTITVSTE